jgi:hypothetical protein
MFQIKSCTDKTNNPYMNKTNWYYFAMEKIKMQIRRNAAFFVIIVGLYAFVFFILSLFLEI